MLLLSGEDETVDPQQLLHEQQQDPVLSQVHVWLVADQCPDWAAVPPLDTETKALYSQ